jgi:hypothetical protein
MPVPTLKNIIKTMSYIFLGVSAAFICSEIDTDSGVVLGKIGVALVVPGFSVLVFKSLRRIDLNTSTIMNPQQSPIVRCTTA